MNGVFSGFPKPSIAGTVLPSLPLGGSPSELYLQLVKQSATEPAFAPSDSSKKSVVKNTSGARKVLFLHRRFRLKRRPEHKKYHSPM